MRCTCAQRGLPTSRFISPESSALRDSGQTVKTRHGALATWLARLLYIALFTLLLPLLLLRLLWRSIKAPAYRQRILERFGLAGNEIKPGGIWIHAVSVGEVVAAIPVILALRERYPSQSITVTTTTPTGSAQLRQSLQKHGVSDIAHSYMPYDWPLFVLLFLNRVKPKMLVVMETELWPVTLWLCERRGIKTVLANARLSEKSARGYQRVSALSEPMLRSLWVATQYDSDADRFLSLGLPATQLQCTGSIKFDLAISPTLREQANIYSKQLQQAGASFVWIAASTHKGEDELMLAAHRNLTQQHPGSVLIMVPRHPERFDDVAQQIVDSGFALQRVSDATADLSGEVVLLDTMGQLLGFYGCADMAFVGGSLIASGGHNPIEPAAWGVPVLMGPHDFNFAEVAQRLRDAGGLIMVDSPHSLAEQLLAGAADAESLQRSGKAALQVVEENRGALEKLLTFIAEATD